MYHEGFRCVPRMFRMPEDKRLFRQQFWPIRTAARFWGVSYHTARRWIHLHPDAGVMVKVMAKHATAHRWRLCVVAGQPKYDTGDGSAQFRDSEFQRSMARRRWQLERSGQKEDPVEVINKCLASLPPAKPARSRQPIPGTNFPDQLPGQMSLQEFLAAEKECR